MSISLDGDFLDLGFAPRLPFLLAPDFTLRLTPRCGGAPLPQDAYNKPIPAPSPETARYWEGCRAHELWLPFCRAGEPFFSPPRRFCPLCSGWDVEWRRASGRGKVYSYAIQYRAFHPGWSDETPYVTALVGLDEGPRLHTNLIDVEPDPKHIQCDMAVEVVFEDISEDIAL